MASGSEELFSGDERNDRRYSYPLQTNCSESEYAPDSESGDESENQHSKEGEERIIQELFSRRKKTPGKDHLTKKARLDPATKQHGARSNDSTFVTTPSRPQVSRHNSSLHSSSASKSHANRVTPPSTTDLRANSQTKDKESDVSHDWSPTVRRHSDALVLETEQGKVTTALGEINVLKDVVRRLTTTEEKLQLMEQRVRTPVTPGSSSSESSGKKARSIPKIVRVS